MHRLIPALLLLLAASPARAELATPGGSGDAVRILIESPHPGAALEGRTHQARIQGSASAEGDRPRVYDVVLAIDVSHSTAEASGIDVDGDGEIGFDPHDELLPPGAFPEDVHNTDPGDSILAAEIHAARTLIAALDPRRVRLGVLTFAGEVDPVTNTRRAPNQRDAWLEVPLTSDFDSVQRALGGILARGARGATNFAAGVRLAIRELAGLGGAQSTSRPESEKVVLFLTDGMPSFPIGKGSVSDPGDVEAAVNASRLAHQAGIRINTYALGQNALSYPLAATEMARVTVGTFTPVQSPGDIVAVLQAVSFANIEDVVFTNLTTGDLSTDIRLSPDGSFTGFVPVTEGTNRVRVSALASDGSRGIVEFELSFQVAGLSDRERLLELERIRRLNKELLLLRERERIDRFREQQRKEIEIQAEGRRGE